MSCENVALLYLRSSSQWRFTTSANVHPDNTIISDRLNLVWWCIIMNQSLNYHTEILLYYFQGQSHNLFYKIFRNTETFATQISLTSFTRPGKTLWKFCTAFTQGVRQRMLLGWLWTKTLPLWAILISQGGVLAPIKKMWKECSFCDEYTCLLNLLVSGSSVWLLHPFVLVMVCM